MREVKIQDRGKSTCMTHSKELLIVDDEAEICNLFAEHFSSKGYKVSVAHSMPDGLRAALSDSPDVIVLDYNIKGQLGSDFLIRVKQLLPGVKYDHLGTLKATGRKMGLSRGEAASMAGQQPLPIGLWQGEIQENGPGRLGEKQRKS